MPGPYYNYSILNDTLNGAVELSRLEEEYNAEDTLTYKLTGLRTSGDVLTITTADDLGSGPGSQKEALDALVAAHTGFPYDFADLVKIQNEDASLANFPKTSRNTPIFQPSIIAPGDLFYGTGALDREDDEEIGEGTLLSFKAETPGDVVVVEGRFSNYVRILGGVMRCWSSTMDDTLSLEIVFPASAPAMTPGLGNASIMGGVFVPVSSGGTHTVDGSTKEVGDINLNLCPVPTDPGTGFWNWDPDQNPSITPAPEKDGNYHLIPAEISALRQANKYPVADLDVTPAAGIQGKKVLPHWVWRFTMTKGPEEGVPTKARILLYTSRKTTK